MQNGVQEVDSPIKKSGKRCRQIVDSDEDEAPLVKEQAEEQGGRKAPAKTEKVKGTSPLCSLKVCQELKLTAEDCIPMWRHVVG